MTNLFALFQSAPETKDITWVKLVVTGAWKGHKAGEFSLTEADLERIKSNFERSKIDLPFDYEHQSLSGGEAPAAGWIKRLSVEDGAIWAKVEWLERAAEQIKTKQYRFVSPVLRRDTIDQITGENLGWSLHSAALTNTPFLEELGAIANKELHINNKEQKVELDEQTKAKLAALEAENERLKGEREAEILAGAKAKVEGLIAAQKLDESAKEAAIAFCKTDPKGFDALIAALKPEPQKPEDDLYAGKRGAGGEKSEGYADLAKYM